MLQPSSLPVSIRTVEWVRDNNGAWLVNLVERYYYAWTGPRPGGPELSKLPAVGGAPATLSPAPAHGAATSGPSPVHAVYAPPRIVSPIVPSLPGEGVWKATGPEVAGGPPVLVTVFRPEAAYPRQLAYVAWIDTTRTRLALYPGRKQPPDANPRGPMQVPQSLRGQVLATFNSGFTYKDAHGGFAVNGVTVEPMVDGQGTVVARSNGRVDVATWQGGPSVGADVVAARQNLPLIVAGGRPNPALNATSQWGATLGNRVRVWRSALGVDVHGNLIYLAAPGQTAPSLADAMIRAGTVRAMELDINATWPSFTTYGLSGSPGPTKLVPNNQEPANRYLVPDDRDFFAVYPRVLSGTP